MTGATELVKGSIERAFTDARRRHAGGADRSQIAVTSTTSYNLTIDLAGDGVPETRAMTLPDGVSFVYDPLTPPKATVDWRGMIAEGDVNFRLRSRDGDTVDLHLSNIGDASINTQFTIPSITVTASSADVSGPTVVNGNTAPNPNPSPTANPTPLPTCTSSQVALTTPCRCATGKHVDTSGDGKCH